MPCAVVDRTDLADDFLLRAGWNAAQRRHLAGDASDRSYERLTQGRRTAILMNAPPGQGDDPADFVRIAGFLAQIGLSVPDILFQDLSNGFLLLEDFGDGLFADLLNADPSRESALYGLATDVLVHLAKAPLPIGLPDLAAADWAHAAGLAVTHYAAPATGSADPSAVVGALGRALSLNADGPRCFIHRDFHAENLLLLPNRTGLRQTGMLDFQLGQGGQPGYDLVSLLQDARRDVAPWIEAEMKTRYAQSLALDAEAFGKSYATLGAQRALRIIGVFARLARYHGKTRYLAMIPRVWGQLQRNLGHPALAELRDACARLPEPNPDLLQRLAQP